MVRTDAVPDDLVVVVRATPGSAEDAAADIASDALQSGRTYVVMNEAGEREPLFGVSVFAHRPGVALVELLARFDDAPAYFAVSVGVLRSAGFVVLPTGANGDHFDVQLLGQLDDDGDEPVMAVRAAAARLVVTAGELQPNPAYDDGRHRRVEEE